MPGVDFTTHVIIDSPLALFNPQWDIQEDVACRDMQMRYVKCIQHYGYYKAYTECRALYEDFMECMHHGKQRSRFTIMEGERKRQRNAGKTREYLNPPFFGHF